MVQEHARYREKDDIVEGNIREAKFSAFSLTILRYAMTCVASKEKECVSWAISERDACIDLAITFRIFGRATSSYSASGTAAPRRCADRSAAALQEPQNISFYDPSTRLCRENQPEIDSTFPRNFFREG